MAGGRNPRYWGGVNILNTPAVYSGPKEVGVGGGGRREECSTVQGCQVGLYEAKYAKFGLFINVWPRNF